MACHAGNISGDRSGCVTNPPNKNSAIEDAALAVVSEAVIEDPPFLRCYYAIGHRHPRPPS